MPVYSYKGKKGTTYYIVYPFNGRRKTETIGKDKKLAEKVLHKRLTEIAENRYLDIKKEEKIRFEDFGEEYLALHSKLKKSYGTDFKVIGLLKKFFGGKYLYEITSLDVDKLKSKRAQEVSPATVNRTLAVLKSMFNKAIVWGKTEHNPCKAVKLFKENNQRVRFLEREEIDKLLVNCSEHLKPIVTVALHTGMRKGEILGLTWHNIDIKRNIVHLLDTKNGEKREVPMNEIAQKTIIGVLKHSDSPYIFCNKNGRPYGDIKKSFLTAIKKSDIIDFRFHDLRHTFASHLVMSGIDLNTVRELLGHKSLEMTLRYSHLSPDHKKRAVDVLGQNLRKIQPKNAGNLQEIENYKKEDNFSFSQVIDNKKVMS